VRCRNRLILWAVFLGILALLTGCPVRHQPVGKLLPATSLPTPTAPKGATILRNYHFVYPEHGVHVWEADIVRTQIDMQTGVMQFTGVRCKVFTRGREELRITADGGQARIGKVAHVTLRGHVHAVSVQRHITLDAETLRWASDTGKIAATSLLWQMPDLRHSAVSGIFSTTLETAIFDQVKTEIAAQNALSIPTSPRRVTHQ